MSNSTNSAVDGRISIDTKASTEQDVVFQVTTVDGTDLQVAVSPTAAKQMCNRINSIL